MLVFSSTGTGYDRKFKIAVPGHQTDDRSDDLVAIWKHESGARFQNYGSKFTILDTGSIPREWVTDLQAGRFLTDNAPNEWVEWVRNGTYEPLKAERTKDHRTKDEQEPSTALEADILNAVYCYFEGDPNGFERIAPRIFELVDDNVGRYDVIRDSRDGGYDAVGKYDISPDIGSTSDTLAVEFALGAKCHRPGSANGVRETSRLISRIRHRQFGVFVTTSHVGSQAYKEIKEDDHPILVLSGGDIAKILIQNGLNTTDHVERWLDSQGRATD